MCDGITFDSKKEASCYINLLSQVKSGSIDELHIQVPFILAPAVILNGRKKPALKYVADFVYVKNDIQTVVDVKSSFTAKNPVYRIKKHLMKSVHGIEIVEL